MGDRFATRDMGRKLGEMGPHLTQCGQGRGLPPCQVSSWSIQPFRHNTPTLQTGQTTVRQHRANRFTDGRPKTAYNLMLTETDQNPQKNHKDDITAHHIDIQAMWWCVIIKSPFKTVLWCNTFICHSFYRLSFITWKVAASVPLA